jgi:hypothetical protein
LNGCNVLPVAEELFRFTEESETGTSSSNEDEGSFSCEKCDKTFGKKSSLARHKFEHTGT